MGDVASSACMGKGGAEEQDSGLPCWGDEVLCAGGDKCIYQGYFNGKKVAVCVSKRGGGAKRLRNEIANFEKIGMHPYVISMYYHGKTHYGDAYVAMELVEPIGYDLDGLKNQYQFAGQSVPVSLIGRIIGQLAEALRHMHGLKLLHRDLKTENVLIDSAYKAKLIDMGICAEFGATDALRAPYLAPELCAGEAQGAEVDCWGVGLILHQVYQHRWHLLNCQGKKAVQMMPGMPSTKRAMEPTVREAMDGLLAFSKADRWTMDTLTECEWIKTSQETSDEWHAPRGYAIDHRQSLQLFKSLQPMPTALAVNITARNHAHLIAKQLGELELGKKLGVTVLLVKRADGNFERIPGAQTCIQRGDWIYFGVPQGEEFNHALDGLEKLLQGKDGEASLDMMTFLPSLSRSASAEQSSEVTRFRSLNKSEVIQSGKLLEFSVEFDCFRFPQHIGKEAEVGPNGLNLRSRFGINLVGIARHRHEEQSEEEVQWFPGGAATVQPGDMGLVMREPCADGSSRPTLNDDDLAAFMDCFQQLAGA